MMKYKNQQILQNNDQLQINSNLSNKISKQNQIKQTQQYQDDEDQPSIYLSKKYDHSKPTFLRTFPQQPVDCQGSEDFMAPTILSNIISNKSVEQIAFKSDHKKQQQLNYRYETSNISSSQNSEKVKMIINQIKVKLLNLIHYSKYNDPLLTKEYQELSPFKYHYFTMYIFLSTIISNFLASIFIPLVQFFEVPLLFQVLSHIIFGFNLISIFQDLFFQRGPYKMCRGIIKVNYQDESKKILDTSRMLLLIFNNFFQISPNIKWLTILVMMILSLLRQNESFENIYRSTHHFIFICQLWITVIISFVCTYQVFNLDEDIPLSYSIVLAISFLTHCSNISIEISNQNSVLISIYMILSYVCLAYTSMIFYIWLKPEIEIQEEKQKLLKGFVERFREKCENDDLLRRCYSYLEFRIDEDLNKAKDQLTKKLSPDLEDEIELSLRSTMIDKIELMNRFSPHFKQQLLYEIEQVQFNPEDNIIIEHQADDLGLFYILKGQVKVQFQGSSFGTNKREVATLSEGQTFGQYSFITGIPSNISIFSSGSTILMKLKRSDFTSIISNYPFDNEIFCTMKDNAFYNQKIFECYYCKIRGHYIVECKHIQYFPQRLNTIEKYLYTEKQQRRRWTRRIRKCFAWQDLSLNQDKAKQYVNKQSQEQISDELPEISQLPYSENQTYQSVSFVSNSMGQKNLSPEQYQSYSNVESFEQFNIDQEIQDEQTIPFQEHQVKNIRKNSNKTTLKTAGFAIEPNLINNNNLSIVEKDDKEILSQLEHQMNKEKTILYQTSRNYNANKLTFQYQKEQSQCIHREDLIKTDSYQQQQSIAIYQQQQPSNIKQSIRQTSNRSNTYSNSLSKDISNNPSSNSRQNRSQKQSMQSSQDRVMEQQTGTRKLNSSKSLTTEQNRINNNRSLKSCTKSTPNQMSQFQALTSPENQGYYLNDILFNKFEKMCEYKIYNPHNNYNQVINRYKKYIESQNYNNLCRKKHLSTSSYSIKCFVVSKIRKVKKLL
ncbi:unnamed protein product [Paramecium pentaurelia]|uniref:Cyclic nucleotide-binding domain-containing protein n=1 Tax=Paramecium pentaurelia TaxID=43138 RepID=A0A8S1VTA5_9CILI|nr:unnamed protein product [Paramecium pentaurelia]